MKIEPQPPESPVATPINLRKLVVEVCRRAKAEAVKPEEERAARELCNEYTRLAPFLLSNPRKEADLEFNQQQRRIGGGQPVQDAYTRSELETEVRVRVRAAKDRLLKIATEASVIGEAIVQRFVKILDSAMEKIQAEQKVEYEVFGIQNYQASLLLQCLSDVPRRLDNSIPSPGGMCCPLDMFTPFIDDLPQRPQPTETHEQRLAAKLATVAERARANTETKADVSRAVAAGQNAAFAAKEARKREMAAQGIIRLGK